jgi:hypothetical protein
VHALCIGALNNRDTIASLMLTQILNAALFKFTNLPCNSTFKEVADFIEKNKINIICISIVAP